MDVLQQAHAATSRFSSDDARLLMALPCLAFLTDDNGVICVITPFALQGLGYSPDEILGRATLCDSLTWRESANAHNK